MPALRRCPKCGPVLTRKVRPEGARCSVWECVTCGLTTRRIKGQPKKTTMPKGLYDYHKLDRECEALWRQVIYRLTPWREEDSRMGECARCKKMARREAAHNIGRRICFATRWDPDNGLPLCHYCHRTVDEDAEEKRALFLRHLGRERYDRLQLMKHAKGKTDLTLVKLSLEATLKEM